MFGLFNKKSRPPEERRVPDFAQGKSREDKTWITSDVYVEDGKSNKNLRAYFAALYNEDTKRWDICQYVYPVNGDRSYGNDGLWINSDLQNLTLERVLLAFSGIGHDGLSPVPGLKGNYREFASQCGAYFDEKDKFISLKGGAPVIGEVLLKKEQLSEIYSQPENKTDAAAVLRTWDDYYREIFNKFPLQSDTPISEQMIERVTLLTLLMRSGGDIYNKFSTSATAEPETLQHLADVGAAIKSYAQNCMAFSPEQAKQLADIIMQGPDPYADKPLPMEEFIRQQKQQPKASPPKSYSP